MRYIITGRKQCACGEMRPVTKSGGFAQAGFLERLTGARATNHRGCPEWAAPAEPEVPLAQWEIDYMKEGWRP